MAFARANGVELWFETFGSPSEPAVVLHMGAGLPGVYWPEPLCTALAARGFFVVRFDARDTGLSERGSGPALRGMAPYSATELAQDVVGLLDALGVARAHVVGASLGAVVAEALCSVAPARVGGVTMYAGMPLLSREEALAYWDGVVALPSPPSTAHGAVEWGLAASRAAAGPAFAFEEERLRALWEEVVARAWYPEGIWRQTACALFTERPGPTAMARAGVPLTVIEGSADPGCARMLEYARAVPGARVVVLSGVGHELPSGAWPALLEAVSSAETAAAGAPAPRRTIGRALARDP